MIRHKTLYTSYMILGFGSVFVSAILSTNMIARGFDLMNYLEPWAYAIWRMNPFTDLLCLMLAWKWITMRYGRLIAAETFLSLILPFILAAALYSLSMAVLDLGWRRPLISVSAADARRLFGAYVIWLGVGPLTALAYWHLLCHRENVA